MRIPSALPRAYLLQADAVNGVSTAAPLYLNMGNWTNPAQLGNSGEDLPEGDIFGNQVRVIAFNPRQPVLDLPKINAQLDRLSTPKTVLFDELSQHCLS